MCVFGWFGATRGITDWELKISLGNHKLQKAVGQTEDFQAVPELGKAFQANCTALAGHTLQIWLQNSQTAVVLHFFFNIYITCIFLNISICPQRSLAGLKDWISVIPLHQPAAYPLKEGEHSCSYIYPIAHIHRNHSRWSDGFMMYRENKSSWTYLGKPYTPSPLPQ